MQKGDLVQSRLLGNTIYMKAGLHMSLKYLSQVFSNLYFWSNIMTYCGLTDFHLVLLDTLHRKLN